MGSSAKSPAHAASAAFVEAFRGRAAADGTMTFAAFMELALYHPELGYYRRDRRRVGRAPGTDFYTATSSAPVFGELIAAAATGLLGPDSSPHHTFVEIGAEPEAGILRGSDLPFHSARTIGIGQPIALSGPLIVFSNELFDAQPFRRFVHLAGRWHERGVKLDGHNLVETTLEGADLPAELPAASAEGYVLDLPMAARELLRTIVSQPWHGLLIACDYGKTWQELTTSLPAGTARAYHQHRQSNDLLARPGEQDLTCHICWDWLSDELTRHGFESTRVQSQESFFIEHAGNYLRGVITAEAGRFSAKKQSLTQLIHPTHLGQKFQVLHARRPAGWI